MKSFKVRKCQKETFVMCVGCFIFFGIIVPIIYMIADSFSTNSIGLGMGIFVIVFLILGALSFSCTEEYWDML